MATRTASPAPRRRRQSDQTRGRPHAAALLETLEHRLLLTAFPGAYGFGANATGGTGGTYYHVTNLNDSGTGSFRDAVSASNRIVVFDVGGTISLSSAVSVKSNITILGQSAPGQGIAIIGREVSFSNSTNDIVQYLRFRQGTNDSDSTKSGINLLNATDMIFDHISIQFAQWNNVDAVSADNITIQNSIIADPIGQQFNAHTEGGDSFTWYNDIFANAHNRSVLAKDNTQFVNNVVYNFQAGYTAGNSAGVYQHDVINNYFITGPSTTSASDAFYQVNNQEMYVHGNMLDSNKDGVLNGSAMGQPNGSVAESAPQLAGTTSLPTSSAAAAYAYDIASAGDSLQRDAVDNQVIADVTSLGTSGHLWTTQTSTGLANNGYGTIDPGNAAHPINNGTYTLRNLASSLALDDPANSKTAGTQMIQYNLSGAANQQWTFTYVSGGYYTITNVSSGLLLDDPGSSATPGVKLDQAAASGGANQLWGVTMVDGGYTIRNKATGLAIDDPGSSATNGGPIDLYTLNSNTNQVWLLGKP